jgi:hypothetical protein
MLSYVTSNPFRIQKQQPNRIPMRLARPTSSLSTPTGNGFSNGSLAGFSSSFSEPVLNEAEGAGDPRLLPPTQCYTLSHSEGLPAMADFPRPEFGNNPLEYYPSIPNPYQVDAPMSH